MSLYENLARTALQQIAGKGRSVTIKSPGSAQAYDPDTDTFTAGTDGTASVKAIFTDFAKKDIDGEQILRTDKRVLIAASALATEPSTTDKLVDGSDEYRIIKVDVVKPGDTSILYAVQVRR